MNYYQHHIGDFNNATRHLTRVERALYRDLIELYYDKEQPLISDEKKLARLVIAVSDDEKEALKTVLEEFFTLKDGVHHNSRCDKEIEKYRANNSAKARAGKASAEARRKKKGTEGEQNSTRVEQAHNATPPPVHNQEPRTSNQEPVTKNQESQNQTLMSGKPDDVVEILGYLNAKHASDYKPTQANKRLISARLKEGFSTEDLKRVIDNKIIEWGNSRKMEKYIRPSTLFNAEKFSQYAGEPIQDDDDNDITRPPSWMGRSDSIEGECSHG